jgi:hypothetical protein
MNDTYVFNNPWSIQSNEKHTSYCAMMRLGLRVPDTWMLPPKAYEQTADLQPTLTRYARYFDLGADRRAARLPALHEAVRRRRLGRRAKVDDEAGLRAAYEGAAPSSCTCSRRCCPTSASCAASASGRRLAP